MELPQCSGGLVCLQFAEKLQGKPARLLGQSLLVAQGSPLPPGQSLSLLVGQAGPGFCPQGRQGPVA